MKNKDRVERAHMALEAYARLLGKKPVEEYEPGELLTDLLTDLRHWCASLESDLDLEVDFEQAVISSAEHAAAEKQEEEQALYLYPVPGKEDEGARMHQWHSGMDAVYGVGSCWYAGKPANLASVEEARSILATCRAFGQEAAGDLNDLVALLDRKIREAKEAFHGSR